MNYNKVVVIGGGVLGSQIAFQSAFSGFNTTVLLRDENAKEELKTKLEGLKKAYKAAINDMTKASDDKSPLWSRGISSFDNFNKEEAVSKVDNAIKLLTFETNQEEAVKDADIVIESITELFDAKVKLYEELSELLDDKTILVTNSSTLLPSKLAKYTKRSDRFLSMHFANSIWKNNVVEVMVHPGTSEESFNTILDFASQIHMVPLPIKNEKSGYLLNSLLVPFLLCAMDMVANDISDPESIDKAWTLGTGAPKGPFQILDTVGLETAKNIVLQYQKVPDLFDPLLKKMMLPYNFDGMLAIINKYIDEGKSGKAAGEGFYKYDK